MAIIISDEDFRAKNTTWNKEGYFVIIIKKRSVNEEDIRILNIYVPDKQNSTYMNLYHFLLIHLVEFIIEIIWS